MAYAPGATRANVDANSRVTNLSFESRRVTGHSFTITDICPRNGALSLMPSRLPYCSLCGIARGRDYRELQYREGLGTKSPCIGPALAVLRLIINSNVVGCST